jgi:hypothetical protein
MVSSLLRRARCNLEMLSSPVGGAEVPWNGSPERVTAPYVAPLTNELVFKESGSLVYEP